MRPEEFSKEMWNCWRDISFAYSSLARKMGVDTSELYVVDALWDEDEGLSQRTICERCDMGKQTVSAICKRLGARDFVTAHPSEADKRERIMALTDEGREWWSQPVDNRRRNRGLHQGSRAVCEDLPRRGAAMSPYALLGLSVLFEVFGDTCMKLSEGFKRKVPIIGIVVGYAVSFYALSHVFAELPLGLAYAVWTSAAVALTAVVSRIIWKEKFNGKKIAGVALIIFGVACLRTGAM